MVTLMGFFEDWCHCIQRGVVSKTNWILRNLLSCSSFQPIPMHKTYIMILDDLQNLSLFWSLLCTYQQYVLLSHSSPCGLYDGVCRCCCSHLTNVNLVINQEISGIIQSSITRCISKIGVLCRYYVDGPRIMSETSCTLSPSLRHKTVCCTLSVEVVQWP